MKSINARITSFRWRLALMLTGLVGAALRMIGLNAYPPGLHFDEAVYGLMALEIHNGRLPVYFSAYTGREPLYMYLMAGVFRLVGIGTYGIRLTSALIGIATIPMVYMVLRELYGNRRLALLAAAITAISYWHLTVSRNGYPNILIPPLECLALTFLWRGYRNGKMRWFVLGGAFVGLVLYTYLAARLFPVTIALFFFYCLLIDRKRFMARFGGLVMAAFAATLVFAPLGLHFINNPRDFWERADQVLAFKHAGGDSMLRVYADNILKTLGGFFIKGDPRWHYNLPGKPIFNIPMAVAFVLGVIEALRNWRKPEYALLIIWTAGMCLPAILTMDLMPQGQRTFGMTPAIFGLAALGLERSLATAERHLHHSRRLAVLALLALFAFESIHTIKTYFGEWVKRPETYAIYNTEYVQLAEEAAAHLEAGDVPVIQSLHYKHPTVIFVAPDTLDAVWLYGGSSFVIPERGAGNIIYLRPADNPADDAITALHGAFTDPLTPLSNPFGGVAVTMAQLKAGIQETERSVPAQAAFADEIEILDWRLPTASPRDTTADILLHWRVLRPVAEGRTLKMHLVNADGALWSQGDAAAYLSEQWRAGDTVYEIVQVPLPPGIPAGTYRLQLVLGREGGGQLPVLLEGKPGGSALNLGEITLQEKGHTIQPPQPGVDFGPVRAIAFEERLRTAASGGTLEFDVTWQAIEPPSQNLTATISLLDATGTPIITRDSPLALGYPTSRWLSGEIVRNVTLLRMPALAPASYQMELRITGIEGQLNLGTVQITGQAPLYEPPSISHPMEALLGDEIMLLGYDLEPESVKAGESLSLRLIWRAKSAISGDYKVFVHLIGTDGLIYGQDDSVPAQWQRPTLGWEVGEIIVDEHNIEVKPETPWGYTTLMIGMYDATDFTRVPIKVGGELQPDDRYPIATVTILP